MKRADKSALPPVATNGNGVVSDNGQHAGLILSPSKKSKLSPDSVVMITPAPNKSEYLDGLSAEDVRQPPIFRAPTRAPT